MKIYEFNLNEEYLWKFFLAIRDKSNVIEVLTNSINYILINPKIPEEKIKWKIILVIDKMNRMFFLKENKYFSLNFPFKIHENDWYFTFSFKWNIIDEVITSKIITVIKSNVFHWNCSLNFAEWIYDFEKECWENLWITLKELLFMEDWYIRYDYDEDNYKIHKLAWNEKKHPLNHYDFFYSNNSTFKLWLENKINELDFINLLNTNTDCKYIIELKDKK